jgi:hypothetical protein
MDPVTIAAVGSAMASASPYIALAGAGASALGAYQQGQETQAADNYNAQVENIRATEAQQSSQAQAQIVDQQNAKKMGAVASAFGAGGVDMSGSPLEVMSSLASTSELNRQLTLYQGKVAASSDTQQATLQTTEGQLAAGAGAVKAGTTLLTGVGTFLGPNGVNPRASGTSSAGSSLTIGGGGP